MKKKQRRWWHAVPEWFWGLASFLLGLAVYGTIGVYRGARRKLRRKASDVWAEPSLPQSPGAGDGKGDAEEAGDDGQ